MTTAVVWPTWPSRRRAGRCVARLQERDVFLPGVRRHLCGQRTADSRTRTAPELLAVERNKVIGLTMNANRLQNLRQTRIKTLGEGSFDRYGSLADIEAEVRLIERLMARYGWRRIDVSYMSVEEVAKEVVSLIRP